MNESSQIPVIDKSDVITNAVSYFMRSKLPAPERALIVLLLRNGLRVSEICEPASIKFANEFIGYVFQRKNKTWRTIATAEAAELLQSNEQRNAVRNWRRNRFYYYRLLRGVLPNIETARTGNKAVTHAARNIAAQSAHDVAEDINAVKLAIGDRTEAAAQRYLKKSQKKIKQRGGILDNITGAVENLVITAKQIIYLRNQ